MSEAPGRETTVIVVGGGFTGTYFALSAAARLDGRVILVERAAQPGRGLAYGACDPCHILNVPVHRMELGLTPSFADWLRRRPDEIAEALEEAGGELDQAFVPRGLFGAYVAERLEAAERARDMQLRRVRGEVVRISGSPQPSVHLADGRTLTGTHVVLATGNLEPRPPACPDDWVYDSADFVPDPWARGAFDGLGRTDSVLLIGAGLTMVDVALKLSLAGHEGKLHAVSRHGLAPHVHRAGGSWSSGFLRPEDMASPVAALHAVRHAIAQARAAGIPWQRVMDAVRPSVAQVWSGWTTEQRAQFLRHLRTVWDVHRHRMAPRIGARFSAMTRSGRLEIIAGRIKGYMRAGSGVRATVDLRGGGGHRTLDVARVVNCTGPRSDFGRLGVPLYADLRERGLLVPDALGLGVETRECALVDRYGMPSRWLFALGPLTRPAWWEITAVPEVAAQVTRLVQSLDVAEGMRSAGSAAWLADFVNLGEGI